MTLFLFLSCARPAPTGAAPAPPPEPSGVPVALTFDDLPYQTRRGGLPVVPDEAVWDQITAAMLGALAAEAAPATVFVNCGNLSADDSLVSRWRAAGHAIGNHTAHHRSAVHTPLADWEADVHRCDGLFEAGAPRLFRFPYLWRGETVEQRDALASVLASAGYTTVPVTIDSHDWAFEFTRRDHPEATAALAALLAENVVDAIAEARAISREKLGREAAQILLLHMNQVTAAALPQILDDLAQHGLRSAPIAEVLADPLYAEPDAWAGPGGRWWLAHTAPTERPDGSAWYSDREERVGQTLEARFPKAE